MSQLNSLVEIDIHRDEYVRMTRDTPLFSFIATDGREIIHVGVNGT